MDAALTAINAEIAGLRSVLASLIGSDFTAAIKTVEALRGKLVVTGMGKAGLIGQKISATLRSTGQPSVFLDPAQALHGDMGMIGPGDGILALSNSGKTLEVLAVCNHARARGLPVICIATDHDCPLRALAQHALLYPEMPEGCPIGCAPMTSTVMMLALGDALAAQLMADRGFSTGDFLALHHGGYLGQVLAQQP